MTLHSILEKFYVAGLNNLFHRLSTPAVRSARLWKWDLRTGSGIHENIFKAGKRDPNQDSPEWKAKAPPRGQSGRLFNRPSTLKFAYIIGGSRAKPGRRVKQLFLYLRDDCCNLAANSNYP